MHGLILRTFEFFTQDTYGFDVWARVVEAAELETPSFEAMLRYDPAVLEQVLSTSETVLNKPRDALLEDVGTYLISHPQREGLRRLMRFGGVDFIDFLYSLDDLPERTRLAVADLRLPDLELREEGPDRFELRVSGDLQGFGHIMVGVLQAMADDYGALALLEHREAQEGLEVIGITVIETSYTQGRDFELGLQDTPDRARASA